MKDCTKIMMCYNFEYIKRRGTRKMKKFIEEFKTFALRGNVMDMAVGVIIGGAFSGIVTSLTDNFINPILNVLTGGATYSLSDVAGFASSFLASVVNFIIMAFILFLPYEGNQQTGRTAKERRRAGRTDHEDLSVLPERNQHQSNTLSALYFCFRRNKGRIRLWVL